MFVQQRLSVPPQPRHARTGLVLLVVGVLVLGAIGSVAYLRYGPPSRPPSSGFQPQRATAKGPPVDYVEKAAWNGASPTTPALVQKPMLSTPPPLAAKPAVTQAPVVKPEKPKWNTLTSIRHDLDESTSSTTRLDDWSLAPGTWISIVVEDTINSDVPGAFFARVTVAVKDTKTQRRVLIPQGAKVVGVDQAQTLLFGNTRLPTVGLTLGLPDGRGIDLGQVPISDMAGTNGLTGEVDQHYGRLILATLTLGALQGGQQLMVQQLVHEGTYAPLVGGILSQTNRVGQQRLGRALDTRPTIHVWSGSLGQVKLVKALSLKP